MCHSDLYERPEQDDGMGCFLRESQFLHEMPKETHCLAIDWYL